PAGARRGEPSAPHVTAAGALTIASFDAMLAEHTPPMQRTRVFAGAQALWSIALGLGALCAGVPELVRQMRPDLGNLEVYRPPFIAVMCSPLWRPCSCCRCQTPRRSRAPSHPGRAVG